MHLFSHSSGLQAFWSGPDLHKGALAFQRHLVSKGFAPDAVLDTTVRAFPSMKLVAVASPVSSPLPASSSPKKGR